MKTKIFALLVALLAIALVLASCGPKEEPTTEGCTHANATKVDAVAATCKKAGTVEHWSCPDCNKKFSDAACTTEATTLTTPKAEHTYEDGYCIHCDEPLDERNDIIEEAPVVSGDKTSLRFMITDNSNKQELSFSVVCIVSQYHTSVSILLMYVSFKSVIKLILRSFSEYWLFISHSNVYFTCFNLEYFCISFE